MHCEQLIAAFDDCFLETFNTRLVGGAEEPLYLPSTKTLPARIFFRSDYVSSALHEISHWCIAGEKRRDQEDYGYWYETDTRDEASQLEFEKVEIKPQALECILHWSLGLNFRVSIDNLALVDHDDRHFTLAVNQQIADYLESGLPPRGEMFAKYLLALRFVKLNFHDFIKQQYENNCR